MPMAKNDFSKATVIYHTNGTAKMGGDAISENSFPSLFQTQSSFILHNILFALISFMKYNFHFKAATLSGK